MMGKDSVYILFVQYKYLTIVPKHTYRWNKWLKFAPKWLVLPQFGITECL